MWYSNKACLLGLAIFAAGFPSATQAQSSDAGCSVFNGLDPFTRTGSQTYRISLGITCTTDYPGFARDRCPLEAHGFIEAQRTDNFSSAVGSTSQDSLATWNTIIASLDDDSLLLRETNSSRSALNQTTFLGYAGNVTAYIPLNTSSYVGFTIAYLCQSGTVSGCRDGYIANDTLVEGCIPLYHNRTRTDNITLPTWWGTIGPVTTDAETVQNMTTNMYAEEPQNDSSNDVGRIGMSFSVMTVTLLAILVSVIS